MKKTIITVIALFFIVAGCKEIKNKNAAQDETTDTETIDYKNHTKTPNELNNDWVNVIVLNNDIKWQANIETTEGVMKMLSLIEENQTINIEDYIKLGNSLNEVKNTVVKECTMEGASHDNLHVWLHPLIKKIELLQKIQNAEEGAQLTSNIKMHLEGYYDYFN